MNSTIYLFVQYSRKTAIDCSKSITKFSTMYKFIELIFTTNMNDLRKLAEFATKNH